MVIKLVIPVTVALQQGEKSSSESTASSQHLWIRNFPRCYHEKENIIESWQALEIVLMVITKHDDRIITACYQSKQDSSEQLVLAGNTIFSVLEQEETKEVDYDYFTEKYQDHIWLVVYCRKCLTIFQLCGL